MVRLGFARVGWYTSADPLRHVGEIDTATVSFNSNGTVPWDYSGSGGARSNQFSFVQTATHELLHSLGLGHSTQGPRSGTMMQCEQGLGEKQVLLGSDDKNGVWWEYTPKYISVPGPSGAFPCQNTT